jgi:predicted cobalt transporter CbtA
VLAARDLLLRGLLAGLLAGVAAFAVAYVVGEPSVNAAITVEQSEAAEHAADGHTHAEEAGGTEVPRSLQSTAGLLTATVVAGATLGGLVGVVSALALGRFGRLGARGVPLLVAGLGFVTVYAVPFLVYPPNPPAVGQADTIGYRTALYFLLVAISLVAGVTAVLVGRRLAARWGSWYATLAVAAGYLVVLVVAAALMPRYDEVPADFPASVLYAFRRASFLTQLTLWGVLGLALAQLAQRLAVRGRPGRVVTGVA